jgi:hypothetical protein
MDEPIPHRHLDVSLILSTYALTSACASAHLATSASAIISALLSFVSKHAPRTIDIISCELRCVAFFAASSAGVSNSSIGHSQQVPYLGYLRGPPAKVVWPAYERLTVVYGPDANVEPVERLNQQVSRMSVRILDDGIERHRGAESVQIVDLGDMGRVPVDDGFDQGAEPRRAFRSSVEGSIGDRYIDPTCHQPANDLGQELLAADVLLALPHPSPAASVDAVDGPAGVGHGDFWSVDQKLDYGDFAGEERRLLRLPIHPRVLPHNVPRE